MFRKKLQFSHNQELQHHLPINNAHLLPVSSHGLSNRKTTALSHLCCVTTHSTTHAFPGSIKRVFITRCLHSLGLRYHWRREKPEGNLQVRSGVLHITHSSLTHRPQAKQHFTKPLQQLQSQIWNAIPTKQNMHTWGLLLLFKIASSFRNVLSFPKCQHIQFQYFVNRKPWNFSYKSYQSKPLQRYPLYSNRHHLRPFPKHKKSSACSINPWTMGTDAKILSSLELHRNKKLL